MLAAAALLGSAALLAPPRAAPAARAARLLNATDTAHLHMVGEESGSLVAEEGSATGGLPGAVKANFNIGANITASFTIYTRGGSVSGHGSAALHSSGRYASFAGTMSISRGTGRYAHAHGTGGLYGVIDRSTYALTVQTTGRLSY